MRKSARYIAQELINYTTDDVYEIWKDMGLVLKDRFGDWDLTELGKSIGGKLSKSNVRPVPTFDSAMIIDKMIEFCKANNIK